MTVGALIEWISSHQLTALSVLVALPLIALWLGWLSKGRGDESPWCIFYSILIYLVCIPGISSLLLFVGRYLIGNGQLYDIDLLIHVAMPLCMIFTLLIIRRSVPLREIPGFATITGFLLMLFGLMALGYLLDRFRIVIFSQIHIGWIVLLLVSFPLLVWWGWRRVRGV